MINYCGIGKILEYDEAILMDVAIAFILTEILELEMEYDVTIRLRNQFDLEEVESVVTGKKIKRIE